MEYLPPLPRGPHPDVVSLTAPAPAPATTEQAYTDTQVAHDDIMPLKRQHMFSLFQDELVAKQRASNGVQVKVKRPRILAASFPDGIVAPPREAISLQPEITEPELKLIVRVDQYARAPSPPRAATPPRGPSPPRASTPTRATPPPQSKKATQRTTTPPPSAPRVADKPKQATPAQIPKIIIKNTPSAINLDEIRDQNAAQASTAKQTIAPPNITTQTAPSLPKPGVMVPTPIKKESVANPSLSLPQTTTSIPLAKTTVLNAPAVNPPVVSTPPLIAKISIAAPAPPTPASSFTIPAAVAPTQSTQISAHPIITVPPPIAQTPVRKPDNPVIMPSPAPTPASIQRQPDISQPIVTPARTPVVAQPALTSIPKAKLEPLIIPPVNATPTHTLSSGVSCCCHDMLFAVFTRLYIFFSKQHGIATRCYILNNT